MSNMPKRQLPYLNRQPGRHGNGKVYWYVRVRGGPRIPIRIRTSWPLCSSASATAFGTLWSRKNLKRQAAS